jgi:MFS transporter, DHA1 family, solute carrier family 18 (vesicular amine transporter), member 1/2
MSRVIAMKRDRWGVVAVVAYALFMDYFIYGLIVPLTPYSSAETLSENHMALLYGSYAAGVLLATPLFGYLGDRIGCKRPMLIGVALSAVATLLFWSASGFVPLIVARLFQGAASAATWIAGLALVAEYYATKRVEMIGFALMGSTAGSLVGPILGGTLLEFGSYGLPFVVTGGLVAIDAAMRLYLLPPGEAKTGASPDWRALLTDRSILVPALAVVLAALGWGIVEPLLPGQLDQEGATPTEIGAMFTIATIAYGLCAPLVGWVSERAPIKRVIASGVVGMAITLPLLGLSQGIVLTGATLCLVSIAFAFALNPTSAELGNAVDRRGLSCYAAVYAVYNIAYSIGMIATNALAASAASSLGFRQVLLCASAALLVCVPLLLLKDEPLPAVVTTASEDQPV